ncbi:MAG: FAD-binding protein [Candidatus Nitronauta litoralis]|uniref:FAD-binding protein n=1 Tax=Candidatus Nitronauta litoralis TaxID=2705533 RepID=A0A7T0G1J5_9BACT|nr:MAG: FAD-binding protein [Candidatus Nitronauta litoralis]
MDWAGDQLRQIEATRRQRLDESAPKMDDSKASTLLENFHPDFKGLERLVQVGPQAGKLKCLSEIAELLEADSPLPAVFEPSPTLETDVLVVGGGGAGLAAALTLQNSGLQVTVATKLRIGDANTLMAEGGIQAAVGSNDSPRRHYADTVVGGHGKNVPELVRLLVEEARPAIDWLTQLGVHFGRTEKGYELKPGGGTSTPRVLSCQDVTGLEIMRVLRDAVFHGPAQLLEGHSAVELCDDGEGRVTGAVLWNSEAKELVTVSARAVLLATGGSGQLRLQGFATSNHLGATGDGLVLAWRQGCSLVHLDSFQYHPTGSVFPEAIAGQLVTESARSMGAQLLNAEGKRFIDELSYRDRVAAAIIREVSEGRGVTTPAGRQGVWLDTPLIDKRQGEGTLARQFPGMIHRFKKYGIDPSTQPLLVYPTLHYQNGGVAIDQEARTEREGLWAAGEVTGGLHGTNRLMGNSLLDIIVFGRRAGESIISNIKDRGPVTLSALSRFRKERETVSGLSQQKAPQLYPTVSGMKFELKQAPLEKPGDDSFSQQGSAGGSSFEPPDPFSAR